MIIRSGDRLAYDERWTGVLAKELGADFRVVEEGLPGRATTEDPVNRARMPRADWAMPRKPCANRCFCHDAWSAGPEKEIFAYGL